jgi:hypothetical protein
VIGGRDDQGLLREAGGFERAQDVADAGIERPGAGMKGGHILPRAQRAGDRGGRFGEARIVLRTGNVENAVGFEESDVQKKRLFVRSSGIRPPRWRPNQAAANVAAAHNNYPRLLVDASGRI